MDRFANDKIIDVDFETFQLSRIRSINMYRSPLKEINLGILSKIPSLESLIFYSSSATVIYPKRTKVNSNFKFFSLKTQTNDYEALQNLLAFKKLEKLYLHIESFGNGNKVTLLGHCSQSWKICSSITAKWRVLKVNSR